MVCERWWLTKMCVCVRDGVWEMVCERWCVTKWRRRREEAGGGGGEEPGIQNQKQVGNKSSEHFETTWFLLLSTRFISFLLPEFQEAHPITKDLRQQVPVPLNMPKHSRKSPANVRNPSVISPEPLPKRPENPSGAMAVFVGRVHLGPRRDQLLDHGGMACVSRLMQRRLASEPYSHGMFLRVVGQNSEYRS